MAGSTGRPGPPSRPSPSRTQSGNVGDQLDRLDHPRHRTTGPGGRPWPAPPTRWTPTDGVGHLRRLQDHRQDRHPYTLTAAATGSRPITSNTFSITIGGASQLAFTHPARRRGQRRRLGHPAGRHRRGRRRQHRHHGHRLDHPRHRDPAGRRGDARLHRATRWPPPTGSPPSPAARSPATAGSYTLKPPRPRASPRHRAPASPSPSARPPSWSSRAARAGGQRRRPGATQPVVTVEDQSATSSPRHQRPITLAIADHRHAARAPPTRCAAAPAWPPSPAGRSRGDGGQPYTLTATVHRIHHRHSTSLHHHRRPATQLVFTTASPAAASTAPPGAPSRSSPSRTPAATR